MPTSAGSRRRSKTHFGSTSALAEFAKVKQLFAATCACDCVLRAMLGLSKPSRASSLAVNAAPVRSVARGLDRVDRIERRVREWQLHEVALDELDLVSGRRGTALTLPKSEPRRRRSASLSTRSARNVVPLRRRSHAMHVPLRCHPHAACAPLSCRSCGKSVAGNAHAEKKIEQKQRRTGWSHVAGNARAEQRVEKMAAGDAPGEIGGKVGRRSRHTHAHTVFVQQSGELQYPSKSCRRTRGGGLPSRRDANVRIWPA